MLSTGDFSRRIRGKWIWKIIVIVARGKKHDVLIYWLLIALASILCTVSCIQSMKHHPLHSSHHCCFPIFNVLFSCISISFIYPPCLPLNSTTDLTSIKSSKNYVQQIDEQGSNKKIEWWEIIKPKSFVIGCDCSMNTFSIYFVFRILMRCVSTILSLLFLL